MGGVAVVGLLATTLVVRSTGDEKVRVGVASPQVAASTYQWSIVKPIAGLGYSSSHTELASGAIYGLSTAPGPITPSTVNLPATLYRSDHGTEWTKVALPTSLSATSIASSGNTLYALGTAPAGGGGRDLVVASSTDGAASWSSITLPHEAADLMARHPGQISLSQPTLAAKDATHQVAAMVVSANLDLSKYKPDVLTKNETWEWTDTGATVYQGVAPCSLPAGSGADTAACRAQAKVTASKLAKGSGNGPVVATYTWKDLGIDPELQGLINGRTYTYVTDDGSHFVRSSLDTGAVGWGSQIVADASGYTLFLGHSSKPSSTTDVLRSTDGHTWSTTTTLPGSAMGAGLLAGRPAVALSDNDGHTMVRAEQADGTWQLLDLTQAVPAGPTDAKSYIGDIAFGPLGVAATVSTIVTDGGSGPAGPLGTYIVHSSDGSHLSVLPIADKVAGAGSPLGVTVSADAITVRLSNVTPGQPPTTPPTQTVLVGTPAG